MRRNELDMILRAMLSSHASDVSDLNCTAFRPPQVEHAGHLNSVALPEELLRFGYFSPWQTLAMASAIMGDDYHSLQTLMQSGSVDLSYQVDKVARFRVNIFRSRGNISIVLRSLATEIPSLGQLKAPAIFAEVVKEKNGLILVTGATGSGKTTTLAAMLHAMNSELEIHVVTLEDPIEFVHKPIKATFNQREQGSDFDTFPNGLRAALRQAPKVILVGEMRDRETMEIGLTAAETGHLVLSTLHTVDAGQTINRIIGMFQKEEEQQIRTRLAGTLRWIICQRLLESKGGGRVAVHEIMGSNLRTTEMIVHGETEIKTYHDVMESSEPLGWQTFESCLVDLYKEGKISEEQALLNSTRRSLLRQKIDYVKSEKGERTSDLNQLEIDTDYGKRLRSEDHDGSI